MLGLNVIIRLMRQLFLFPAIALAAVAQAWDLNGHRIVATIAYDSMKPKTRIWVDKMLKDFKPDGATSYTNFVNASTLADDFKYPPSGSPLRSVRDWDKWHYVDYDFTRGPKYVLIGQRPEETVVAAIGKLVNQLKTHTPAVSGRGEDWALAMLIHFVGDTHQPLHGIDYHDSGGNGFKLKIKTPGGNKDTNLHSLWDNVATINYEIKGKDQIADVAKKIELAYPMPAATALGFAPDRWSKESFDLAVKYGYGGAQRGAFQTSGYLANWKDKGLGRMALAGYRLAALLDALAPA